MNRTPILYTIFILFLLISCSSTAPLTVWDDKQIHDGKIAIKEMMKEAMSASIDKTRDKINSLSFNTILPEEQKIQYEQEKSLPGVTKRLNTFSHQLTIDLNLIFDSLKDIKDSWIDSVDVSDPYRYIMTDNDQITILFKETFVPQLESYLKQELNARKDLNEAFNKFLTIINAYIITENVSLIENKKELFMEWDNSLLVSYLVDELILEMATQEAIIRYLSPSYDSPYIQLFSK